MNILLAQDSHIDQIKQLHLQQIEFNSKLDKVYYSTQSTEIGPPSPEHDIVIAHEADQVFAFLTIDYKNENNGDNNFSHFAEISHLFVDPKFRHRGVASAMVSFAEKQIRTKNYKVVKVQVSSFNDNALHLYRKLDYVDRQRHLYKTLAPTGFIQKAADFIQSIFHRK